MIVCRKCGQQADQGETFCRSCNAFLEWFGAPATTPEGPPAVTPSAVPVRPHYAERESPRRPIAAKLGASSVLVDPGGQASVTFEVHNRGHTVDRLSLEILGPVATWSAVDPPQVNLMPGTSAVATVVFRPPRSSAVTAGPTPADVVVRSHEHPDAWVVERIVVEVNPFTELEASLAPSVLRGVAAAATRMRAANRGNAPVELSLTADDPETAFQFRISPPTVRVGPGATADATVDVRPREALPPGRERTRPFRVLVTLGDGSRRTLDGTFTQTAEPEVPGPPILATLARNAVRVEPGAQVSVALEMLNQGLTVDQLSLEMRGPAAAWATVDPVRLNLMPDRSAAASIVFHPPRTPDMLPGPYPVDVVIRSREHPEASVLDHVMVDVVPFADIEPSLTPSVLHGGREATATIGILNTGNTRLDLTLDGEDPEMAFTFRISPPAVRLDPGRSASARIQVRSRKALAHGTGQARPFRVLLTARGGARRAVDGTFVQAVAERRRWPCLVRALVPLALLAVGGFVVLNLADLSGLGVDESPSSPTPSQVTAEPAAPVPEPPAEVPHEPARIIAILDPSGDIEESGRLGYTGSEGGFYYRDVHLAVEVQDPEDGDVIEEIRWETDQIDLPGGALLGIGPDIMGRLYSASCEGGAVHTITVIVIDSRGDTATAVRRIAIGSLC